jgi:hypothetical protein
MKRFPLRGVIRAMNGWGFLYPVQNLAEGRHEDLRLVEGSPDP